MFVRFNKIWPYLIGVAATLFFGYFVFKLWQADLTIPFSYSGDSLWSLVAFKTIKETDWPLSSSRLGAPGVYEIHDFPTTDALYIVLIKLTLLFFDNFIVGFNVYYLLTFVLITLTSLAVFKQFKIKNSPALVGSLLFSFASYHFTRGQSHLFLASYFMVPLVVMVCLWTLGQKKMNKRQWYFSLITSFLIGSSGVYYAFFSCFFLLISSFYSFYFYKDKSRLKKGIVLLTCVVLSGLLNLIPTRIYHLKYGENSQIGKRSPVESEIYGLRMIQLFMPYSRHGFDWLNNKRIKYLSQNIVSRGEMSEYLGLFGTIGFVILVLSIFQNRSQRRLVNNLGFLNLWGLALGIVTGLGTIIAYLALPNIRAYNRISIFLTFFSIFALIVWLEKLGQKVNKLIFRLCYFGLLLMIVFVGIWDQTSGLTPPLYAQIKQEFTNDKKFVAEIESSYSNIAMIFQLPYKAFPETPPINKITDYDLFRPYLHSQQLHWSYGAPKGRSVDQWQQVVSQRPAEKMLKNLVFAGFSGLYIDRTGYPDNASSLEGEVSRLINQEPLIAQNQQLAFFNLNNYKHKLKNQFTEDEWQVQKNLALNPVMIEWGESFSDEEKNEEMTWRWSGIQSEAFIVNGSEYEREVNLELDLRTGYEELSQLEINAPGFKDKISINSTSRTYNLRFTLPPGKHKLEFLSQAEKVIAPNDPRNMRFRIVNFKITSI